MWEATNESMTERDRRETDVIKQHHYLHHIRTGRFSKDPKTGEYFVEVELMFNCWRTLSLLWPVPELTGKTEAELAKLIAEGKMSARNLPFRVGQLLEIGKGANGSSSIRIIPQKGGDKT